MTQANPYCFEFKFNRMNPLNLTNEDFGEIQIYSSTYRRDPQQRSREFFRQFKLTQIATILPNETYVSFTSSPNDRVHPRFSIRAFKTTDPRLIDCGRCKDTRGHFPK